MYYNAIIVGYIYIYDNITGGGKKGQRKSGKAHWLDKAVCINVCTISFNHTFHWIWHDGSLLIQK